MQERKFNEVTRNCGIRCIIFVKIHKFTVAQPALRFPCVLGFHMALLSLWTNEFAAQVHACIRLSCRKSKQKAAERNACDFSC